VFLTVEQGTAFAAAAAHGSIASVAAQAAFAAVYVRAGRFGPIAATATGAAAFAVVGVAVRVIDPPLSALVLFVAAALVVTLRSMPRVSSATRAAPAPPPWDLPARAAVATILVVALTTAAPALGPLASGIVSGFPLYATVLAVFAHRLTGSASAVGVMRGLVVGLFGFGAFFIVIALALVPLGPVVAFLAATGAVLVVQGISLSSLRRAARQRRA
jgi:hypothetical protein